MQQQSISSKSNGENSDHPDKKKNSSLKKSGSTYIDKADSLEKSSKLSSSGKKTSSNVNPLANPNSIVDARAGKHKKKFPGCSLESIHALSWPLPPMPMELLDAFSSSPGELVASELFEEIFDSIFHDLQTQFLNKYAIDFAAQNLVKALHETFHMLCPGHMAELSDAFSTLGIDQGDPPGYDMDTVPDAPRPAPLDCMAGRKIGIKQRPLSLGEVSHQSGKDLGSLLLTTSSRLPSPFEQQSSFGSLKYDESVLKQRHSRKKDLAVERALEACIFGGSPTTAKNAFITSPATAPGTDVRRSSNFSLFESTMNSSIAELIKQRERKSSLPVPDALWKYFQEACGESERIMPKNLADFLAAHGVKVKPTDLKPALDEIGVDLRKGLTFPQFSSLIRGLLRIHPQFTLEVSHLDCESVSSSLVKEHERLLDDAFREYCVTIETLGGHVGRHKTSNSTNMDQALPRFGERISVPKLNDIEKQSFKKQFVPGLTSVIQPLFEIQDTASKVEAERHHSAPAPKMQRPISAGALQPKTAGPVLLVSSSDGRLLQERAREGGSKKRGIPSSASRQRSRPEDFRPASASPLLALANASANAWRKGHSKSGERKGNRNSLTETSAVQEIAARVLSMPTLGQDGIPRSNMFYKRPISYAPDLLDLHGQMRDTLTIAPGVTIKEKKKGKPEKMHSGPSYPETPARMRKDTFQKFTSALRFVEDARREAENEGDMRLKLNVGNPRLPGEMPDQDFLAAFPDEPIQIYDEFTTPHTEILRAPLSQQSRAISFTSANSVARQNRQSSFNTSRTNIFVRPYATEPDYVALVAEAAQTEESAKVRLMLQQEGLGEVNDATGGKKGQPPILAASKGRKGSTVVSRRTRIPPKPVAQSSELSDEYDGFVNRVRTIKMRSAQFDLGTGAKSYTNSGQLPAQEQRMPYKHLLAQS